MNKIRMLISDTAPLYPPLWGGPKRIWNLYNNFSQERFEITYVGATFGLKDGLQYDFKKIRDNFKEISCQPAPHYYLWHFFEKAFFKNTNLDLFVYLVMQSDWQFRSVLGLQDPAVIVCSHPWSSLCIKKKKGQFFIYDAHNCEYLLMDRILGGHPLKHLVLQRVRRIEKDACRKSDLILACSEKEKQDIIGLYKVNAARIMIVTNGSNVKPATTQEQKMSSRSGLGLSKEAKVVVFTGAYYKPNIDAARFIIKEIAPGLTGFNFLLIGNISDAFKSEQLPANVKLSGRVSEEQLEASLRACDIAINPMFDGSGTNIKMLEYMAYGLPVVTTLTGARGIETFGRQPMLIVPAQEFCAAIQNLSSDQALTRRLAEEGRSLIAEHYSWKEISRDLEDVILEGVDKID